MWKSLDVYFIRKNFANTHLPTSLRPPVTVISKLTGTRATWRCKHRLSRHSLRFPYKINSSTSLHRPINDQGPIGLPPFWSQPVPVVVVIATVGSTLLLLHCSNKQLLHALHSCGHWIWNIHRNCMKRQKNAHTRFVNQNTDYMTLQRQYNHIILYCIRVNSQASIF